MSRSTPRKSRLGQPAKGEGQNSSKNRQPISPEIEQRIDELTEQFRQELRQRLGAISGAPKDMMPLPDLEEAALSIREKVGQAIVEEITQAQVDLLEQAETEAESRKHACMDCQRSKSLRGKRERTITTMAGEVYVERRVYYCALCNRCTMPLDQQLKLPGHRFTGKVEQWVARLCVKDTFERAMAELYELGGVSVSPKEAQRIVMAIGEYLQEKMQQDIAQVMPKHRRCVHLRGKHPEALSVQYHEPSLTGYVSMDGVMVPMDNGVWREAKLGHVELVQEPRRATALTTETPRTIISLSSFHLGKADEKGKADECARQVYTLAARAGIVELCHLVALADGAEWIWKRFKYLFPLAIQILDWYHAMEHLNKVIRFCLMAEQAEKQAKEQAEKQAAQQASEQPVFNRERSLTEKTKAALDTESLNTLNKLNKEITRRVEEAKTLMWDGNIKEVIRYIKKLPQSGREAVECVRETVGYYRKNEKRMNYPEYRAKGLRIGSGAMESACKQIVTARMKGAGMRWSEKGAEAMGHLRTLYLSTNRWEQTVGNWPGRVAA